MTKNTHGKNRIYPQWWEDASKYAKWSFGGHNNRDWSSEPKPMGIRNGWSDRTPQVCMNKYRGPRRQVTEWEEYGFWTRYLG